MALSLKESQAVADLAKLLYDFLPGSGNPRWTNHVSFKTVAEKVGVGDFWQPGSKEPMICALLERTLEHRRGRFEPLILEIVRGGIVYRGKGGNPLTPGEVDDLNGLILEVGFKFPDLWDPSFKASLSLGGSERAQKHVKSALESERLRETERDEAVAELDRLKEAFFGLHAEEDRQKAGRELETVLNRLFELSGLAPREPFRVTGEQIDGSFELDHEVYLLEAKWEKKPLAEAPLLIFRGKVTGKSRYTRGVFVAINGLTDEAKEAIGTGKENVFFVMEGYDLTMILEGAIPLSSFLRQRQRLLADEGAICVPYTELCKGSRTSGPRQEPQGEADLRPGEQLGMPFSSPDR